MSVFKPKNIARWLALIALLVAINIGVGMLLTKYSTTLSGQGTMLFGVTVFSLLLLYALLLAIPFVPGIEIGISLMVVHGPAAAPFVHGATVFGLLLAYGLGQAFSDKFSCRFLSGMGLERACNFVENMKSMNREQRLKTIEDSIPPWAAKSLIKHRYLMLALALNLPGNSLIGGGGGIAMVAGLSRLYSPVPFFVMLVLASAPVPVLYYFFGSAIFFWVAPVLGSANNG